ncbi:MAG: hypothetical protein KF784_10300 [Fimbriimonadaceae bacterium]|nr:hypothetical protein [Fimbriimonadaceae bacterium]
MKRLLLALLFLPSFACANLNYTLRPDPAAQSIRVSLTLDQAEERQEFRIPAWCPGFYTLLDYDKKMSAIRATDPHGNELKVETKERRLWTVLNPTKGPVTFSYSVLGDDEGLGFFRVNVRKNTAFVNGPAAFVFPTGRLQEPATLRVNLPGNWDIATGLEKDPEGYFKAKDYDELIDCPIEMGIFERRQFEVSGIPFEAVFVSMDGKYGIDLNRTTAMLAQISAPAIKMMRGAPFKRYSYFIHLAVGDFSGGLEHRNSTVMSIPNRDEDYLDALASHEFFHSWNVKQIRPSVLGPFDYTKQARTANLWFAEGVTDYYAHLHVYQSGVRDSGWLLESYQAMIQELQRSRQRLRSTIEETSTKAWENGGFGIGDLSYYTKGALMGWIFDAEIRSATDGKKSLDDVMSLLYARHKLPQPGYPEDGILKAINEVSGKDFTELYNQMARTTQELPYERLSAIGLRIRQPGKTYKLLGFTLNQDTVQDIMANLVTLGLRNGDRIVKVLGKPFTETSFSNVSPDQPYDLHIVRNGQTIPLRLKLQSVTENAWRIEFDPFATPKAIELRKGWLKS